MSLTEINSNLEILGTTTLTGTVTNSTYALCILNSGNPYSSGSTLQWKKSYSSNIEIDENTYKITFLYPGVYFLNYNIKIDNTSTGGTPSLDNLNVNLIQDGSGNSFTNYAYVPSVNTSLNNYFMIQTTSSNETWSMTIGGPAVTIFTSPSTSLSTLSINRVA
jgi:hypothetical protein